MVLFQETADFPPAMGKILSVRLDPTQDGVREYVVQIGPKLLGVYEASQLVCLWRGDQFETPEQLALAG